MAAVTGCTRIIALSILLICVQTDAKVPGLGVLDSKVERLDTAIHEFLEEVSAASTLKQLYSDAIDSSMLKSLSGADEARDIAQKLGNVLREKMEALKESVQFAEDIAMEYTWTDDLEWDPEAHNGSVQYVHAKLINESDPDFVYSDAFKQNVNFNVSSVHIPVEIYEGDIKILNGLSWTNKLDEIWMKNREKYPSLLWQYFGSQTGIMRNFPASKWRGTEVDLYDVRRRPWYTQGASSPKDMLILIDTSGSTQGQALALMQQSAKSLLDTLGENDFVNVANFSDTASVVGCFDTFVQANYRNKKVLFDAIDKIKAKGMASYAKGFEFAFQQFEELEQRERLQGEGANCNRIIMFLTDGGTEMPEEVFKKYNWPEKKIRIFSYAVGPTANPVAAVKWIACSNRGYFYKIPAMGAIRSTVQGYQQPLSNGLVGNNSQAFQWTSVYEDLWVDKVGLGMMTTVTLPVYNRTLGSTNQTILGVMGSDVTVSEMEEFVSDRKLGPNGYAFAINSNGYIVFHPNLQAVEGYLSDPPNVDILEVEYETEEKEQLRREMIEGQSGETSINTFVVISDGRHAAERERIYHFTNVPDSNFSLAVVLPKYHTQYLGEFLEEISVGDASKFFEDALSAMLIAPWDHCPDVPPASNTSTPLEDFFSFLVEDDNSDKCDSKLLQHLFFDAKVSADMDVAWKQTMDEMMDGPDLPPAGMFLATDGGLTRVYPPHMNESLAPYADTWDAVYYKRSIDNGDEWIFSAEYQPENAEREENATAPVVMATKAISLDNGYKPAVIGVLLGQEKLRALIHESAKECEEEDMKCYLLDDGGFLIASGNVEDELEVGRFFGHMDPVLMDRLNNESVYLQKEEYDYQGVCQNIQKKSSAGIRSVFVPAIFELLSVQWWTTKLAWAYLNFNVYNWLFPERSYFAYGQEEEGEVNKAVDGMGVEDSEFLGNYSCILHQAQYYFPSDDSAFGNGEVSCSNVTRLFVTTKLDNTNLILVMVEEGECDSEDAPRMLQEPTEREDPNFVGGNCNVTERFRLRPPCYEFNPDEDTSDCGGGRMIVADCWLLLLLCVATRLLMQAAAGAGR